VWGVSHDHCCGYVRGACSDHARVWGACSERACIRGARGDHGYVRGPCGDYACSRLPVWRTGARRGGSNCRTRAHDCRAFFWLW